MKIREMTAVEVDNLNLDLSIKTDMAQSETELAAVRIKLAEIGMWETEIFQPNYAETQSLENSKNQIGQTLIKVKDYMVKHLLPPKEELLKSYDSFRDMVHLSDEEAAEYQLLRLLVNDDTISRQKFQQIMQDFLGMREVEDSKLPGFEPHRKYLQKEYLSPKAAKVMRKRTKNKSKKRRKKR